ncbi:COX15/CtaA family protein [Dyadobacter sediminis]|uniref:Heme A synthase n=1 Tax=Dyadobacter sediminis TaxID=1493691 RepID=A0A5R9K7K9_9BACT|nr:COX15/CtaA family protein [Dyadobacter sediminis]TLU89858.1 heme A synthase [Dyadobacter sediminis]
MTSSKTHIDSKANRRFRRLALNTVITLYFLIIAGGVVRSTGAGMGCPDWPRCFGRWIPPTEISQLPADYKEIYGAKLKGEIEFNPIKTWIEYVNRLLGAFTGIMIFLTLLASVPILKSGNTKIFLLSLSAFILVGFQGWLGAKVVSYELLPIVVTLHMLLAIVIVFLLLYLFTWAYYANNPLKLNLIHDKNANKLGLIILVLSLAQILLGTQVRETMDEVIVKMGYDARNQWMDSLGFEFYIHRSFSLIIFGVNIYWISLIIKSEGKGSVAGKIATACLWILVAEIGTGILMAYFGVPPFAQPIHLTLAILLIGLQFIIWLLTNGKKYLVYKDNLKVKHTTI